MREDVPSLLGAHERAVKSWSSDGLYSIISGLGVFALGLGLLLENHRRNLGLGLLLNGLAVVVLLDQSFFRKTLGLLKARITYPRTGYVAFPNSIRGLWIDPALLASEERQRLRKMRWLFCGVVGSATLMGVGIQTGHRWLAAAGSICIVLITFWCFGRKFAWYASLPILAYGAVIAFFPADMYDSIGIAITGVGAFSSVLGATKLGRYLKHHPAPHA